MSSDPPPAAPPEQGLSWWRSGKSNALTDLSLTLPVFLVYHLGVVLLRVRNAADPVTAELTKLAERSLPVYWAITAAIGVGLVVVLLVLGRGQSFSKKRFGWLLLEASAYAFAMRIIAGVAVGALPLAADSGLGLAEGIIMSCGAGFYEEIAFRVGLFGMGVLAIKAFFGALPRLILIPAWAVVGALLFAGWHYFGPLGDSWNLQSFAFRAACGGVLTAIYAFRGFAPAVWTHLLYDIWAMTVQ